MEGYINLIKILKNIKFIVNSPETDVIWTRYNSVEELIQVLDGIIERLSQKDETVIDELRILFAPTGELQDISISNGWGNLFIDISQKFDEIIDQI